MDVKTQVEAASSGGLAILAPELATLAISGKDRVTWLNGMVTCDLLKRAAGAAVYGLAVARSGKVMADVVVVADDAGAGLLVAVPAAVVGALREHLDHHLIMEDVEIDARTDGFEVGSVHGPRAEQALQAAAARGAGRGARGPAGAAGAGLFAPVEQAGAVRAALAGVAALGDEAGWEALRLE